MSDIQQLHRYDRSSVKPLNIIHITNLTHVLCVFSSIYSYRDVSLMWSGLWISMMVGEQAVPESRLSATNPVHSYAIIVWWVLYNLNQNHNCLQWYTHSVWTYTCKSIRFEMADRKTSIASPSQVQSLSNKRRFDFNRHKIDRW